MTGQLEMLFGRLAELERTATAGPWRFAEEGRGQFDLLPAGGDGALGTLWRDEPGAAEADAALVCALRNALPDLLALADRCRAAEIEADRLRIEAQLYRERWQKAIDAFEDLAPDLPDRPALRMAARDEPQLAPIA